MRILTQILALTVATLAAPVIAQDRDGNDTPGEWVITHHKPYGLWDSFCDERRTGDLLEERCYLRYVDVFSPRPNFGALFVFVTPDGVEIGLERGTRFEEDGMRIETDGAMTWVENRRSCRRGGECVLEERDAQAFLDAASAGGALRFTFIDRHGAAQDLSWDLSQMEDALTDYRANAADRNLL